MSRYVDLSERVTAQYYDAEYEEWTQETTTIAEILDSVCDDYTVLPSTQPQRIKGRWERKESDLSWWYECSECGESPLFDPYEHEVRTPFCPWCGAKMETEQQ